MQILSVCKSYHLWVLPCQGRGQAVSRGQGLASGAPGVDNRAAQVPSVERPALGRGRPVLLTTALTEGILLRLLPSSALMGMVGMLIRKTEAATDAFVV